MKHPRRKSLEKKLAAAISVVNLLNAGAPVALPYVNLARHVDGVAPGALVHVAEANEYYYDYVDYVLNVNYGDTTTIGQLADAWVNVAGTNIVKKGTGGMQLIGGNAMGQIDLNLAGGQVLSYGNSHGNITVLSGGYQAIEHNASGTIETMYGGKQSISGGYAANGQDRDSKGIGSVGTLNGGIQSVGYDGGTAIARVMNGGTQVAGGYHPDLASVGTMNGGTQFNWGDTTVIDVMNGGTQIVGAMDTTKWHKGKIGTMKGGTQFVGWGEGSIDVLSGGTQYLESLPFQATVSVGTMYGGTQVITNYQDRDPRSGGGIISTMIGGEQNLGSSTWGRISSMSGGTQIVPDEANGDIIDMGGGTQIVLSGGTGRISSFHGGTQIVSGGGQLENIDVRSGAILEEHPGAKFINVFFSGGTHRIVDLEKNGYVTDNRTLEVGSGARTSGTQVKSGSSEVVLEGGSSTDAVIASGGSQIVSGGSASLADLSSGATQTVYGGSAAVTNIKSGAAQVVSGGSVSAETLEYGGEQDVYGGEVTLSNMKVGGTQYVFGGTGSVSTVSGGTQVAKDDWKDSTQVVSGGTGKIGTLVSNGNQMVAGGTGMVSNIERDGLQYIVAGAGVAETVSNHGKQHVYGGSGTIKTMNGGLQVISAAHVSVTVNPGGKGTIEVFNGGTQQIFSGGTGSVGTLAGGRIEMGGGVFKGNITGHGTLWNVSMGGTVTAVGGGILGTNLSAGTLAVADGGSVYIRADSGKPGNIKANTIVISAVPAKGLLPVSATGNITVNTVDFTGLKAEQAPEEYTFVSAGGTLSDLTVKRNDFTATLKAGDRIEKKVSSETAAPTEVLTLGYDVAHTLAHTGKALSYKFERGDYKDATFGGTIPWTSGGTYFDAKAEGYAFESNPSVDLAKLGFSFTADEAAAASLAKGQSMTLLANVSGAAVGVAAPTSFALSRTGSNTALSGTANGKAAVDGSAVKYTLDSVTLDNVTVTGVDGAADSVPEGWTSNTAGVAVDAGSFTTPLSIAGKERTLLTASSAMFSDGNITGVNRYATGKDFSDEDAGVTISGTWSHGIYASSDGKSLVFDAGDVKAGGIALGAMAWGTPRALTGEYDCDFSGVATVDASALSFTGLGTSVAAGTYDLLRGANGLAAGKTVTGKDHTQTFTAGTANGANLSATLSGTVSTAADTVQYQATVTLDGVDLSKWDGAKAAVAVPTGWTANTEGVRVTGSLTEPADVIPGTSRAILTTDTTNYFSNAQIDEALAFQSFDFSDEDAGVAFAGTQSKGVAVGGDRLNDLVYATTEKNVADITLGGMAWDHGRVVTLKDGYAFMNAEANASRLTFTFTDEQKAGLSADSTMVLLDGAASLTADTTTVTGADRTQWISLEAANDTTLSGMLKGVVSAADKQLVYRAESMTLDSVELSGRNSMTTSAEVPDGWTKGQSPVSVNTEGPTPHPEDMAKGPTTILTSINGVFADAALTGPNVYGTKAFTDMKNGVTLSGTWARGVRTADGGNSLVFVNSDLQATGVALGEMDRTIPRALDGALNCSFTGVEGIDATGLVFRNPESIPIGSVSPLLTGANGLRAGLPVTYAEGAAHTQNIEGYDPGNGVKLNATLTGTVSTAAGTANYTADSTTLTTVSLAGWDGVSGAALPDGWTGKDVPVETGSFEVSDDLLAGVSRDILTAADRGVFGTISGDNVYKTVTGENERNGVTLTGSVDRGVKAGDDGSVLRYVAGNYIISGIAVGETTFAENSVLREVSGEACDYSAVGAVDASAFSLTNPTEVAPGRSMTLLAANDTLRDLAAQTKEQTYSLNPAEGVTLAGRLTGKILAGGGAVRYTAAENRAESLTFGTVEWKDSGALMARPEAISFDGAAVDTSQIAFTGVDTLADQSTMTLVSNFDGAPGSITGDTYRIGLAFEGKGSASMNGSDLIFRTESAPAPGRAAHRTLMAGLVGMATLSAGNEFIGAAAEGLALDSNVGSDGVATFAKLGGGNIRQETGSHIDVHTWNAILALGHANKKERGTFRYGAFFEYGTGNYTTHEDGFRGDGSARYTGGGLLAKWTANHGFYVEGSLRAGSVHNDARNVLREADGTPHSFETNTPYFGAHIGVGKEIELKGGNSLDIYGKYFYNRRNSTSFDAGGHFDLDAVTSGVLSVGARYLMKREKWNFYGGLAYQHEFDGTAAGRVNGLAIRSADIGGGSVKLELGATVKPDEKSPWSLDLSLTGFAGKKRGMMGGVSVAWMF